MAPAPLTHSIAAHSFRRFPHHELKEDILHLIDTIYIAYNDTSIWKQGMEKGLFEKDFWRKLALNPTPDMVEPIWDEHLSREELSGLLKLCYTRFCFRPRSILKKLFTIGSIGEFMLHVKGALTLLGGGGYKRGGQDTRSQAAEPSAPAGLPMHLRKGRLLPFTPCDTANSHQANPDPDEQSPGTQPLQ